jgi:leader peptidase (prepilin peptidase)/N-methyltransferase
VDTLLVAGASLAGLVIGGTLDPVGQRLAERSRIEDERRRAERQAAATNGTTNRTEPSAQATQAALGSLPVPETTPPEVGVPESAAPATEPPLHLLPTGRAPGRTAAAALVTAVLFGAAADHFGSDVIVAPFCVFFAMLVAVSVTDLSHRLVPRHLLYAALALIVPLLLVTSAVDHRWYSLSGAAIAGAVAFGLFFAVWWFVPRGMGFGDVRLAGAIGLTVGYLSVLHAYLAFLAGFVIGMVFGLIMVAIGTSGRKTRIPFAPSLAVGAVVAVLWGGPVAHHLFHAGS